MKLASKWIVKPYNPHINKSENSLTSKEKIEKIVNNKNIVDIDKLNLINQIINKNTTSPPLIAEHRKEENSQNFQFINDHIQTDENPQENNIEEQARKIKKKKKIPPKPSKNTKETEELINKTFENIQHYLPPTAATRNKTSQFIVPLVHLEVETKKKKSKKRKIQEPDEEEEDVFQDANNEIIQGNGIKWVKYVKKR